jgi:hypothetical protein
MRQNPFLRSHLTVLLGFVVVIAVRASAAPIFPGGTIPTPPEPDPVGGVVVAGGVPVPFSSPAGPGHFSGTLTTTVISGDTSNPLGGLTFTYKLTNDPTSLTSIGRMTDLDYAGFLTDVSYHVPVTGLPSTTTDRSAPPGSVIGWSFTGTPVGLGSLPPGASSALLVVQTNAPSFFDNVANIIDGSIVSVHTFAPTPIVPEPASLALLSVSAIALLRRRG